VTQGVSALLLRRRREKSRLTPPNPQVYSKGFPKSTISSVSGWNSLILSKTNGGLDYPRTDCDATGVPLGWFLLFPIVSKSSLKSHFHSVFKIFPNPRSGLGARVLPPVVEVNRGVGRGVERVQGKCFLTHAWRVRYIPRASHFPLTTTLRK